MRRIKIAMIVINCDTKTAVTVEGSWGRTSSQLSQKFSVWICISFYALHLVFVSLIVFAFVCLRMLVFVAVAPPALTSSYSCWPNTQISISKSSFLLAIKIYSSVVLGWEFRFLISSWQCVVSMFKVEFISRISYNEQCEWFYCGFCPMWLPSIGDKTIIRDQLVSCGPTLIDCEKKLDFHEEAEAYNDERWPYVCGHVGSMQIYAHIQPCRMRVGWQSYVGSFLTHFCQKWTKISQTRTQF